MMVMPTKATMVTVVVVVFKDGKMRKAISGCVNDHFGASRSSFHLFSGGSSAVLTMVTGKKSGNFP